MELHTIIMEIWEQEEMPREWKLGIIQPIYKKGDKQNCTNYRGITLLNVAYKVLSNIILKRLSLYSEKIIGEHQGGFRKVRGTIDQIFIVRQAMEKCLEPTTDLHMLLVDFRQAFDSIDTVKLINYMYEKGIPKKVVELIRMTFHEASAKVIVEGRCGSEFTLENGMRQGDAMSATLFNIALPSVLENIADEGHIVYKSKLICAYADVVILIARSEKTLKEIFTEMSIKARKMGLEVNQGKTKYMIVTNNAKRRNNRKDLVIDEQIFEKVETASYLGTEVYSRNVVSGEIQKRLMAGNRAYYANLKAHKVKSNIDDHQSKAIPNIDSPCGYICS